MIERKSLALEALVRPNFVGYIFPGNDRRIAGGPLWGFTSRNTFYNRPMIRVEEKGYRKPLNV